MDLSESANAERLSRTSVHVRSILAARVRARMDFGVRLRGHQRTAEMAGPGRERQLHGGPQERQVFGKRVEVSEIRSRPLY